MYFLVHGHEMKNADNVWFMMIELRKVCNIVVDAADFVAQRRREKRLPATANDTGMCQNQLGLKDINTEKEWPTQLDNSEILCVNLFDLNSNF